MLLRVVGSCCMKFETRQTLLANNVVSVCMGLKHFNAEAKPLVYTCFLYVPSRIASKCSLEYTEPQGLEGLFKTIALVRSSIRDSR